MIRDKVAYSLKLMKAFAEDDVVEICYSTGKDSDVILSLAKEAGIKYRAIFKNTTIDSPGAIDHAKEMNVEIVTPPASFFKLMQKKGIPSRWRRWCCEKMKEYKILDKQILGVRAAESTRRAARYVEPTGCRWYGAKSEKNYVQQLYPIFDWTDADVLEYITERGIKLHPHYYASSGEIDVSRRVGCMCCPLQGRKKLIADFKTYPNMLKAYIINTRKYLDAHKHTLTYQQCGGDVYKFFLRTIVFDSYEEVDERCMTLFGSISPKVLMEEIFGVKLP